MKERIYHSAFFEMAGYSNERRMESSKARCSK